MSILKSNTLQVNDPHLHLGFAKGFAHLFRYWSTFNSEAYKKFMC